MPNNLLILGDVASAFRLNLLIPNRLYDTNVTIMIAKWVFRHILPKQNLNVFVS